MTDIGKALWNDAVSPATYAGGTETYQAAVLERYKLCVEMADRVSARRNLTNTFFLALNSAVGAALVGLFSDRWFGKPVWALAAGLVILLAECGAWFMIVRSYRLLNSAKFLVIGAMEERLPAYAYSRDEWDALGRGQDWRKYLPLSHVEQWVPIIFATTYLLAFVATTVKS